MIEIEFSAIARKCLHRRISTIEQVRSEVLAIVRERDEKRIKLNGRFSISVARIRMNSHYQKVHPDELRYKETSFTVYLV